MEKFEFEAVLVLAPLLGGSLLGCASDDGTQGGDPAVSGTATATATVGGASVATANGSGSSGSSSATSAASATTAASTASATVGGASAGAGSTTGMMGMTGTEGMGGMGGTGTESATGGGGSGGSGGASSTGAALTPEDLVGALDGYLYRGECNGGTASFECPLSGCTGNVFNEQVAFGVAGDAATVYDVTLHVYGVVELRSDYAGGARRQGSATNASSAKDFWYEGGAYTPGAGYNVYGLRVTPAVEGVGNAEADGNNYFLNARDASGEAHEVWELNFEATFPVVGGGSVEFTAYDPNCLQIMNNAETARPSGDGPEGSIVVPDVDSAEPPPGAFEQPLSTGGRTGQWVFIDVLEVKAR
ncbi:MAG TPA: hypothetical protein VI197_35365 [Polyangiaceae bacterium]